MPLLIHHPASPPRPFATTRGISEITHEDWLCGLAVEIEDGGFFFDQRKLVLCLMDPSLLQFQSLGIVFLPVLLAREKRVGKWPAFLSDSRN
jgi:hypothetical protein